MERRLSRDLRPLGITAAVALVSCGLLGLAVGLGWLGADVGRGANFCEAARDGLVKQPANTFSNLGFVVAGLLVAWRAGLPSGMRRDLATAYACLVVVLGPASAAMHATQTAVGGRLDMASMYLVASFIAGYAAMRWWRRGPGFLAALFVAGVVLCLLVGEYGGSVPVFLYAGNVAFAVLLVTGVVLEVLIRRRGETRLPLAPAGAALGCMLVAFAVWNASQHGLCDPDSLLQGHAVWHLLGAAAAYFLFRAYAGETVRVRTTRWSAGSR